MKLIILDIWNKTRILSNFPFRNNRPTKKFTPKLLKKLAGDTVIVFSIEHFTKELQDKICWNTAVDMKKLIKLVKTWEKMISTGVIEKITNLHIIP